MANRFNVLEQVKAGAGLFQEAIEKIPGVKKTGEIIDTESIVPEPTSAATFAALHKLEEPHDALIVAVNTGDGKKMMNEIDHLIKH